MNEVKELVEELRNKKSRDNRDLLDRSADMIERLAKELCDKSGCHHKCHDTKDCVVEDEAKAIIGDNLPSALTNEEKVSEKDKLLLITENKSNNFDVKSNNELFKQALVEGLNRRFDREIEEAKKIELIEEMAKVICPCIYDHNDCESCDLYDEGCLPFNIANALYNAGYRKQSEAVEEYRQKVNTKMGKHTHLLGKEYVQRILREVAREMKGGE